MKEQIGSTNAQRRLVEYFLSTVGWVIMDHIKIDPQVCGINHDAIH